ncbi:MAG TPA: adenylate/guanylate cyclase domain-containing protein [Bacteroidia bacterium]|nr:adenylate/guanylate cyclase domain-containing protein [Bacteroidia bacterium]
MKRIFLILLWLATSEVSASKQGKALIDSLLSAMSATKDDTNRVNILNTISYTYFSINPDTGIAFGEMALKLSEQINWKKGIANSYSNIATNYLSKSDYPKTLEYLLTALKINEVLGLKKNIASNLATIGVVYQQEGEYDKALNYYSRSLKLNEEIGYKRGVAMNLTNIGGTYYNQNNYEKALENDLKALTIYQELSDSKNLANLLGNIGIVYQDQNQYLEAFDYTMKAITINRELGEMTGLARNLINLGSGYFQMAKENKQETLDQLVNGRRSRALQLAKNYTDTAIAVQKELGYLNALIFSYEVLSAINEMMGDQKAALDGYRQYTMYKDSAFNMEKENKLTALSMQYEFDKKEAAKAAEQEKIDIRQRNIRNSISAGLAGALVFSLIVYRQRNRISREKKRSEELLLNILPEETAEELKLKGKAEAKSYDEVTVMFTDFKNFTQTSERLTADELVKEIHNCYSEFDRIITKHHLEKIKTIGDSYMCAGGLPVANKTNSVDAVNAALEILQFISQEKIKKEAEGKPHFEIRIGLHSGPVVAGIVGIKKFAYDIWGDTVNIASRMESSGEPGKVNVSGTTYELVKDKYKCTYRGKIEAKNKGTIDMYFIEGAL